MSSFASARLFVLAMALPLLLGACGKSDSSSDDAGRDGQTAECPDMTGSWAFTINCPNSASGTNAPVTQNGCDISSAWEDENWTGTVDAEGHTSFVSDATGDASNCTGVVDGDTWESDCTPGDCHMSAER